MTLLSAHGIDAGYGTSQVLFDVSLEIGKGEVVGLLGRNGMGKTTLIRTLFGLMPTRSGETKFQDTRITGMPPDRIARLGLAIVPEGRQVFPNLTVLEHLTAFADNRARLDKPWTPQDVLALFPSLGERLSNMGHELSGGEQQMLAIGRALVTNPALLIMDEATEGLAPLVRDEIWRCLHQLREQGQTILVVDKYVNRLIELADRHVIIERGRVVWRGSSQQLDERRDLWQRYLGI